MDNTGTMTLTSPTAVAVWKHELVGQISDGMWENSGPRDHWKFWCRLEVAVGEENKVAVEPTGYYSTARCRKNAYNFAGLYTYVGDRMLNYGRMVRAGVDPLNEEIMNVAGHMPPTLALYESERNRASYLGEELKKISPELAKAFYEAKYTMKDLRADIKLIKATMKQVAI